MQITAQAFRQRFPAPNLSLDHVTTLLGVLKPIELSAGQRLIGQGDLSDTLYFLWSGHLVISIESDGVRLVLGKLEPGRWVCEFGFIDPGSATADVGAEDAVRVFALSQESMDNLYKTAPNAASALLQAISLELAERLRATSRHSLEKKSDNEYTLQQPPENEDNQGWFSKIGRKLMGLGGE